MQQDYRSWFYAIAANRNLRGEDLRLLLVLLANTNNDCAQITPIEIANQLGLRDSNVARAIKRLFEEGIIKKKKFAGKLIGYRFSTEELEREK